MALPPMEKVQFALTVIALPLYAVTLFFNYASSDASLGKPGLGIVTTSQICGMKRLIDEMQYLLGLFVEAVNR